MPSPVQGCYGRDDAYFRLFDLEADPKEEHDLRKTETAAFTRMVERYKVLSHGIKEVKPYACRALKGAPEGRDY